MSASSDTFKHVIEKYSVPCLCETLQIFPGIDLSQFAPANLSRLLCNQPLQWRIGKRDSADIQWETSCLSRQATIDQIVNWSSVKNCSETTKIQKESHNTRGACCPKHYWCYADYMYMKDIFKSQPDVLDSLCWDKLGFCGKTGMDSTMWIGTAGAHTLCHYDTYGYNIVIQISGSKRWVLFPPSDSDALYPTRIPYEESSVFSEVNLGSPDLTQHPKFSEASACSVVLRPGDILYVPHHWWHYVENLELSVSINLWCDMESDAEDRLHESVTRIIFGAMTSMMPVEKTWINPTENTDSVKCVEESLQYLNNSLQEISRKNRSRHSLQSSNSQQIFHRESNPILIKPLDVVNFMESPYIDLIHCSLRRKYPINQKMTVTAVELVKHVLRPKIISSIVQSVLNEKNPEDEYRLLEDSEKPRKQSSSVDVHGSNDLISLACGDLLDRCSSTPKGIDYSLDNLESASVELERCDKAQYLSSEAITNHRDIESPTRVSSCYDHSLCSVTDGENHADEEEDMELVVTNISSTSCTEGIADNEETGLSAGHIQNPTPLNFENVGSNFPLATLADLEKFERQLEDRKKFSALVCMIKYDAATSLSDYFDHVMPKLFTSDLIEQCGISRRNDAFTIGQQFICAISEALRGHPQLRDSSESLISRRIRYWQSTCRRKTLSMLKFALK